MYFASTSERDSKMRKRGSSAQLAQPVKRQRSSTILCAQITPGKIATESTQDAPNTEAHFVPRSISDDDLGVSECSFGAHKQTKAARRRGRSTRTLQIQDPEDDSSDSDPHPEARHVLTPSSSSQCSQGVESWSYRAVSQSELETLEARLRGVKVRDPDHSTS